MNLKGKRLLYIGGVTPLADIVNFANRYGIVLLAAGKTIPEQTVKATAEQYNIDVSNPSELEKVVVNNSVDGILVIGNEDVIDSIVKVSKKTGLPFYINSFQWEQLQNKQNFKANCKRHGIPVVETYSVAGDEDIKKIPESAYPVVLKPVDSCGSKGISVCNNSNEVAEALKKAASFSRTGCCLCEKYMDCPEITIEYLFDKGNVILWGINDRYVNREQKNVGAIANGLAYPSKYAQLYLDTTHEKMVQLIKEFKIYNGTMFVQAFVYNNTIIPYDPGLRFAGSLTYFLTKHIFNVNPLESMICAALTDSMYPEGEENPLEKINYKINNKHIAKFSILVSTGKIAKITGLEQASQLPEVFNFFQLLHEGDTVTRVGTLQQCLARFQIEAESREKLQEIISLISNTVKVEDENGNNMRLKQKMNII